MKPKFLNVDLEVVATARPRALMAYMDQHGVVLHSGKTAKGYFVTWESGAMPRSPKQALRAFTAAIRGLNPAARKEYAAARQRQFSIGYETQRTPCAEIALGKQEMEMILAMNGTASVVLYNRTEQRGRTGR